MEVEKEITKYGFRYGALEVERLADAKGYVAIRLKTPYKMWDIEVSPKGKNMSIKSYGQTQEKEER